MLDVREVIRRLQLGEGDRPIARDLQMSRKTVAKYRAWAQGEGLMTGSLPDPAVLQERLEKSLPVSWSTDFCGSDPFPESSPYYKDMLSPTTSA